MIRVRFLARVAFLAVVSLLPGCGSGGGSSDLPETIFEGFLLDPTGSPIEDAEVYIFDTNESSLTDADGRFTLESFRHLDSASFYFRVTDYSNPVTLGEFPTDTRVVRPVFSWDRTTRDVQLSSISFSADLEPLPEPTATAAPGEAPGPRPTATPKPALFDSEGNTSAFGIPSGLKGNINAGRTVWTSTCQSCHAAEKTNRSYGQTKASVRVVPDMQALQLTNQQIAHVTAYLNRGRR